MGNPAKALRKLKKEVYNKINNEMQPYEKQIAATSPLCKFYNDEESAEEVVKRVASNKRREWGITKQVYLLQLDREYYSRYNSRCDNKY